MTKKHMDYIIVFRDGSRRTIGQQSYDRLIEESGDAKKKFIQFGESVIVFSSIAKILDENEYYRQYPEHATPNYDNYTGSGESFSPTRTKDTFALEQMIIGVKQYIASTRDRPILGHCYKGTTAPIELLKLLEAKLDKVRRGVQTQDINVLRPIQH